jgi:hypothetical protein
MDACSSHDTTVDESHDETYPEITISAFRRNSVRQCPQCFHIMKYVLSPSSWLFPLGGNLGFEFRRLSVAAGPTCTVMQDVDKVAGKSISLTLIEFFSNCLQKDFQNLL